MSARTINALLDLSQTIGTSSTAIITPALLNQNSPSSLPGATTRLNCIIFHNCHASNNVAINPTGGPAVINGQGCWTIAPLGYLILDVAVPINNMTAIASAASTPLSIHVMQ